MTHPRSDNLPRSRAANIASRGQVAMRHALEIARLYAGLSRFQRARMLRRHAGILMGADPAIAVRLLAMAEDV